MAVSVHSNIIVITSNLVRNVNVTPVWFVYKNCAANLLSPHAKTNSGMPLNVRITFFSLYFLNEIVVLLHSYSLT